MWHCGVRSSLTQVTPSQSLHDAGRGLLESKYEVPRLLPWRTRGAATLSRDWDFGRKRDPQLDPKNAPKPKLARAGMREPAGTKDGNAWFVRTALTREPGQKYASREPLPFPIAHRKSADHRFRETERAINFEYDMKRQLVHPVPKFISLPGRHPSTDEDPLIVQHICCNTIPWRTVAEFNETRDLFEQWRHKHDGQLKTLTDWRRWEEFQAGTVASQHGVRRSKGGVIGQALRIFRRAYVRRDWGLPGGSYKGAAEALTAAGYPTTEQDFKNALRDKAQLPKHTIPPDGPGICELVGALLSIWPEFEWERLVLDPGPDYLRQMIRTTQLTASLIGGNAGEFQTAV